MNRKLIFSIFFIFLFDSIASTRIIKESNEKLPNGWDLINKRSINDGNRQLKITFAVKQSNLEKLDRLFWQVSDPKSKNYGNFLSLDQINEMTRPSSKSLNEIKDWLAENGIVGESVKIHPSKSFFEVEMELSKAERMFETTFGTFVHRKTGKKMVKALSSYSLPSHIAPHVDFISGFRLPNLAHRKSMESMEFTHVHPDIINNVGVASGPAPVLVYVNALDEFAQASFMPRCQNNQPTSDPKNPCSEFSGNPLITGFNLVAYQNVDEKIFRFKVNLTEASCDHCNNGSACTQFNKMNGYPDSTVYCRAPLRNLKNYLVTSLSLQTVFADGSKSEATKDEKLTFSTSKFTTPDELFDVYGVPKNLRVTNPKANQSVAEFLGQYYAVSDLTKFFNFFGLPDNSKLVKVIGPNDESKPGGEATLDIEYIMGVAVNSPTTFWSLGQLHEGQEPFLQWITDVLNSPNAPLVHSISYGDDENTLSGDYVNRINIEFKKAGLRGLSLFFSSGDNGVFGGENFQCNSFTPSFPASSPFVTAVGATLFSTLNKPICFEKFAGQNFPCHEVGETTSSTVLGSRVSSGGGFSSFFDMPQYQKRAVSQYLPSISNIPNQFLNRTGRAYPDISAIGHNFVVILSGKIAPIDGTSASAPVVAGLVTLLNDARLNAGKGPMGFINPWLYSLTSNHFNDITTGDNRCSEIPWICCKYGYPAVPGYDASTGLGSPNFEALLESALRA